MSKTGFWRPCSNVVEAYLTVPLSITHSASVLHGEPDDDPAQGASNDTGGIVVAQAERPVNSSPPCYQTMTTSHIEVSSVTLHSKIEACAYDDIDLRHSRGVAIL